MDRFLFWKKKKNPTEASAQYLANLMGTSVAGFVPEPPNDKVDLDTELFIRNNVSIASLVIIAGLLKGNQNQKALILRSIKPAYLGAKSIENYLFTIISDGLKNNHDISSKTIEERIPEHSQVIYGEPANEKSLEGDYFKWSQIVHFEPTNDQIGKAVENRQDWARKEGLLDET